MSLLDKPFLDKLLMPKKLVIAGCVMIAALSVAIGVEWFTGFDTSRYVRVVFFYLLLDYCWATVRRQWLDSGF